MNNKAIYTKKARTFFYIFLSLFVVLVAEIFYMQYYKTTGDEELRKKRVFVGISGLPDLAISTEASYVRHRSLSNISSIYKDDPNLREYFPSTYAISHSHIINKE